MFQSAHYQQTFSQHQLCDFEQIWQRDIAWFEAPNVRRGGWSGVGQLSLRTQTGESLQVFVKKQENHGRRTWRHPIQGEPTFRREFERLQYLAKLHIAAPRVVYYAESRQGTDLRAILITEALRDFEPLDVVTERWFQRDEVMAAQKQTLLASVADAVCKFHESGLVHRALYPKHVFVKHADALPEVALIDLEKARFSRWRWYRTYFDLAALTRHAAHWQAQDRVYFYQHYLRATRLSWMQKMLGWLIVRRSQRR